MRDSNAPEELAVLFHRRPFVPIRIHITDGMTYDIRHPENVMVLRAPEWTSA